MPKRSPSRLLRWQATAILTLFFFAVAGAAAIGWWYARELPAHQGPIVLISVDGFSAPETGVSTPAPANSQDRSTQPSTSGIEALSADAVTFERAYTHSPLVLPAHASLLSGRLPFEHGVRDEAGFTLEPGVRTLAELLRNRGFKTGGAVSSFLLRRNTGIAQGFLAYSERADDPIPPEVYLQQVATHPPNLQTDDGTVDGLEAALNSAARLAGVSAVEQAEQWARKQEDQRYFLFLEVGAEQAEEAVTRISRLLQSKQLYDRATIVLVGARGTTTGGDGLEEQALRVPLLVKQPHREGAGRRISVPVQHIDLLPTILDLVRAPIPGDLKGRSLRGLLTDERARIAPQPIYSESLAAYLRFSGQPLFGLTVNGSRYIRGMSERIERIEPGEDAPDGANAVEAGAAADATPQALPNAPAQAVVPLRATLDRFLAGHPMSRPSPIGEAEREGLALAGYLAGLRPLPGVADLHLDDFTEQAQLAQAHRRAAHLVGQRRLPAAIYVLQRMVQRYPSAATVQYQIGLLSATLGRTQEATMAFEAAAALRPDAAEVPQALAAALLSSGRTDAAQAPAELAVTLARPFGPTDLSSAHQLAARVALARKDRDLALTHADAAQTASPTVPMRSFVEGRLLVEAGEYEAAVRLLVGTAAMLKQHETSLEGLYTTLAGALSSLNRWKEAENACLEELRAFPHSLAAYSTLARIADHAGDDAKVESVMQELLASIPTPDGYAAAVRLWKEFGAPARAEALRSDARARFRADPSLARTPARDARP